MTNSTIVLSVIPSKLCPSSDVINMSFIYMVLWNCYFSKVVIYFQLWMLNKREDTFRNAYTNLQCNKI